MKKDLAIAMAIAKKNKKKMAKGGSVEEGPSEKANQQGVHKIVPNYDRKHNEVKHGQSEARYGDKKAKHEAVIEELRKMPKPNIKGLAKGGPVDTAETVVIPDRGYGKIIRTGMAEGGKVKSDMDHGSKNGPEGYSKYQEQSQNQKGVHKPVSGVTGFPGGKGTSQAGDYAKDRHGGKAILNDEAKKEHHKVIDESRKMPKPKLQGLARGGMVESNLIKAHPLDAIGQILKEHEAHIESQMPPEDETEHMDYNDEHALHSKDMAEGGKVDEKNFPQSNSNGSGGKQKGVHHEYDRPGQSLAHPDTRNPSDTAEVNKHQHRKILEELRKMPKPKLQGLARGGEVMEDHDMMQDDDDDQPEPEAEDEDHASIASAIMAKRAKYAEGGAVDIDENAEEPSNMYDKLNRAILKENYAEDMDDVSQPQDSNEHGDSIDADDHDRISIMRRKMALKRMAK